MQEIGGEFVEIQSLMGPGVDPHLYKATVSDLAKAKDADIIFYNGLHLEGRVTDVLESLANEVNQYLLLRMELISHRY